VATQIEKLAEAVRGKDLEVVKLSSLLAMTEENVRYLKITVAIL
jgi:hypothetical protein